MCAHESVPSIEALDVDSAERQATCQDCDWRTEGTATAPLAAAHAAAEDHRVTIEQALDFAAHPGTATNVPPLNVAHSNFDGDTIEVADVTVSGCCHTSGCRCGFGSHETPLQAALLHGQRYNHDGHGSIRIVVDTPAPEPDDDSHGKKEIVASLH